MRYIHDGSESLADSIELELELAPGSGFVLPGYLQGRHRLMLHVEIESLNDPPLLLIPPSKVLRLAQVRYLRYNFICMLFIYFSVYPIFISMNFYVF